MLGMEKLYGWGLPVDISTHGAGIDLLIYVIHAAMVLLFVGWFIFLVIALWKFRARKGHEAEYNPHHHFKVPKYVEIGVAIFEFILLAAFSMPIWLHTRTQLPPADKAFQVRVVAQQFAWNVHYPGKDGLFGRSDPKLIDASNPIGLDRADAGAKDDVVAVNQLHVPVNTPVLVKLSSKDVIHSFDLPVARVKQDAIPGHVIPVWFQAKQTGNFEIACAQLCGLGHYRMRGFFIVEEQEKVDGWLAEQVQSQG